MNNESPKSTAEAKESYAEHLARVIADADQSKALLQAQYKALHSAPPLARDCSRDVPGAPEE